MQIMQCESAGWGAVYTRPAEDGDENPTPIFSHFLPVCFWETIFDIEESQVISPEAIAQPRRATAGMVSLHGQFVAAHRVDGFVGFLPADYFVSGPAELVMALNLLHIQGVDIRYSDQQMAVINSFIQGPDRESDPDLH